MAIKFTFALILLAYFAGTGCAKKAEESSATGTVNLTVKKVD